MADGGCNAFMAAAAEEPGPADAPGWGRAEEIPAIGSVLDAGHSPFDAFGLRACQAVDSPPFDCATPLNCDEEADAVDVVDACDDKDEDEFVR